MLIYSKSNIYIYIYAYDFHVFFMVAVWGIKTLQNMIEDNYGINCEFGKLSSNQRSFASQITSVTWRG